MLVWGEVLCLRLPLVAIKRLITGDFLDESSHPHTPCDQACSRLMHGSEQLAPSIVDSCNILHIDFEFFA
jgi:hypothetical protein